MNSFSISIKTIIAILVVLVLAVGTHAHMSYSFSAPDANLSKEQQLHNRHMNHFKEFNELQREMDRIFSKFHSHFFDEHYFNDTFRDDFFHKPLIDMAQSDGKYIIKMDIPGVNNSSIKTIVENNILTVKAEVDKTTETNSSSIMKKERYINKFQRSISLPNDADNSKMKTDYKDGVLTITIPKR